MAWSDVFKSIPDVIYKVAKLAVDIQNVQKDVEELQKQNRTLTEKVIQQQGEINILKALNEANNKAHLQEIAIAKHDLEKYIAKEVENIVSSRLARHQIDLQDGLAQFARENLQHSQKLIPATTTASALLPSLDGNDEKSKL